MPVFASGINAQNVEIAVRTICTKLHTAFSDARAIQRALNEWTDPDLMAALGSNDPADVVSLREVIASIVALEENYRGVGTVDNRAYHIGKRVDITAR